MPENGQILSERKCFFMRVFISMFCTGVYALTRAVYYYVQGVYIYTVYIHRNHLCIQGVAKKNGTRLLGGSRDPFFSRPPLYTNLHDFVKLGVECAAELQVVVHLLLILNIKKLGSFLARVVIKKHRILYNIHLTRTNDKGRCEKKTYFLRTTREK